MTDIIDPREDIDAWLDEVKDALLKTDGAFVDHSGRSGRDLEMMKEIDGNEYYLITSPGDSSHDWVGVEASVGIVWVNWTPDDLQRLKKEIFDLRGDITGDVGGIMYNGEFYEVSFGNSRETGLPVMGLYGTDIVFDLKEEVKDKIVVVSDFQWNDAEEVVFAEMTIEDTAWYLNKKFKQGVKAIQTLVKSLERFYDFS